MHYHPMRIIRLGLNPSAFTSNGTQINIIIWWPDLSVLLGSVQIQSSAFLMTIHNTMPHPGIPGKWLSFFLICSQTHHLVIHGPPGPPSYVKLVAVTTYTLYMSYYPAKLAFFQMAPGNSCHILVFQEKWLSFFLIWSQTCHSVIHGPPGPPS